MYVTHQPPCGIISDVWSSLFPSVLLLAVKLSRGMLTARFVQSESAIFNSSDARGVVSPERDIIRTALSNRVRVDLEATGRG
jgi:hypothetical protein